MSAINDPIEKPGAADDAAVEEHVPTPDQDGPHDVPDDQVIEKTLPAKPVSERGSA